MDRLKNLKSNLDAVAQLAGILAELGQRIQQVGQFLHPQPAVIEAHGPTLLQLINEMLMAKAAKGVRERYLVQLRHTMVNFSKDRLHRPAASITPAEIQDWLTQRDWEPATRRTYLTDVRTLFNFGVDRNLLKESPAKGVELPLLEETPAFVHTPEEVTKILHTAQKMDKDLMRLLAVQYFTGARPLEASQIEEKNILPGLIEIEGPKSKTRQRRLVTAQPALQAFLDAGGKLPVKNLKRRWLKVRKAAGVKWYPDVTRDSFCSYHLAHFGSAAQTALEAGHTEQMLFSKYRAIRNVEGELITKMLAGRFWAIRPK